MKLSQWARKNGINYKTAYAWFKSGKLPVSAHQTDTGTILVDVDEKTEQERLLGEILEVVKEIRDRKGS